MSAFRTKLHRAIREAIDTLAADRAYGQTAVDASDNETKKHIEQVVNAELSDKSFVSMVSALEHIKNKLSLLNFEFDTPKEPSSESVTVVVRQTATIGGEPITGPEVEAEPGSNIYPESSNTFKLKLSSNSTDSETGLMKLTATLS